VGKVLPYEPSIRVPLILRGPGVPRGARAHQLVSNVDLAPTILDAADASPGRVLDGLSLLRLARDPGLEPGRDILIEGTPSPSGVPWFTGVRTRHYLYVEWPGESELYDLARDPYELQSLHGDPRTARLRLALSARLARLRACAGAACRPRPKLALRLRAPAHGATGGHRCLRGTAVALLRGPDRRHVQEVTFLVGSHRVRADHAAPFRARLPSRRLRAGGLTRIRARVQADYDRLATYDRRIRVCR
jgi:hypothetical protein